ncbi:MAG: ATP-binding protein [Desulfotignum sp.]|nr:ATP-binding protein [Desulfotignum sp.]
MTDPAAITPDCLSLSIPSHPRYLQLVRSMVKKVNAIIGVSRKEGADIVLAVDEACANIIRHSYKNQPLGTIDLYFEIRPMELGITIEDFGCRWDPANLPPRNLDEIKPGGLGIHIINCVMDCVEFDCSSNTRNQVRMIKRFKTL